MGAHKPLRVHRKNRNYLLSGILHCMRCGTSCGGFLHRESRRNGPKRAWPYYICATHRNLGREGCAQPYFRQPEIEAATLKFLQALMIPASPRPWTPRSPAMPVRSASPTARIAGAASTSGSSASRTASSWATAPRLNMSPARTTCSSNATSSRRNRQPRRSRYSVSACSLDKVENCGFGAEDGTQGP